MTATADGATGGPGTATGVRAAATGAASRDHGGLGAAGPLVASSRDLRAPDDRGGTSRRLAAALGSLLAPAAVIVAVLVIWQLVTTLAHIAPAVLPGPRLIVSATWDDRANLWPAITTTTEESVLGLVLAVIVAVVIGIAIDSSRVVRGSLYPLIVASQTLPIIALAPMVVIWFGFGLHPKIVLVALFTFFPIVVGLVQGLGSADPDAVNLLRTLRAGKAQLLITVRLPGALPQFFTGLKISVTYAFTSATVAEFVGASQGLGYYMTNAEQAAPSETDLVLGATFVIAILTVVLFVLVGILQRLAMPWRAPSRS